MAKYVKGEGKDQMEFETGSAVEGTRLIADGWKLAEGESKPKTAAKKAAAKKAASSK